MVHSKIGSAWVVLTSQFLQEIIDCSKQPIAAEVDDAPLGFPSCFDRFEEVAQVQALKKLVEARREDSLLVYGAQEAVAVGGLVNSSARLQLKKTQNKSKNIPKNHKNPIFDTRISFVRSSSVRHARTTLPDF